MLRSSARHVRRAALLAISLTLASFTLGATAAPSQAAAQGPCDIYAAGGTPCVAAHSTTRALYAAYSGALYQVKRASDGATASIGVVSAGGAVNAAQQDSFCAGTTCTITEVFDQSGRATPCSSRARAGPAARTPPRTPPRSR